MFQQLSSCILGVVCVICLLAVNTFHAMHCLQIGTVDQRAYYIALICEAALSSEVHEQHAKALSCLMLRSDERLRRTGTGP